MVNPRAICYKLFRDGAERTSDWLTRAGDWVQAAAIAVGVLLFVVLLPLWLAVAIAQVGVDGRIFALEAAVARPSCP